MVGRRGKVFPNTPKKVVGGVLIWGKTENSCEETEEERFMVKRAWGGF